MTTAQIEAVKDKPLLTPRRAEITFIAERFPAIARRILVSATPLTVNVLLEGGTEVKDVRLDRSSLYVRWRGERVEAFWIKAEDSSTLVWPSAESFDHSPSSGELKAIKAIVVPAELL